MDKTCPAAGIGQQQAQRPARHFPVLPLGQDRLKRVMALHPVHGLGRNQRCNRIGNRAVMTVHRVMRSAAQPQWCIGRQARPVICTALGRCGVQIALHRPFQTGVGTGRIGRQRHAQRDGKEAGIEPFILALAAGQFGRQFSGGGAVLQGQTEGARAQPVGGVAVVDQGVGGAAGPVRIARGKTQFRMPVGQRRHPIDARRPFEKIKGIAGTGCGDKAVDTQDGQIAVAAAAGRRLPAGGQHRPRQVGDGLAAIAPVRCCRQGTQHRNGQIAIRTGPQPVAQPGTGQADFQRVERVQPLHLDGLLGQGAAAQKRCQQASAGNCLPTRHLHSPEWARYRSRSRPACRIRWRPGR